MYDSSNEITACQKITNCDVAVTPGICDKCNTNYVFSSFPPERQVQEFTNQTRNSQIDRTSCVYFGTSSANVLAVDFADESTPVACTSKSQLDFLSKKCVPLISDEGDSTKNCRGYSNENCIKCNDGFWMKFRHKQIQKCTMANDLSLRSSGCAVFKNSVFSDPNSAFSGNIECLKCHAGFELDSGSSQCVDIKNVHNCAVFNISDTNNLKCSECLPGYKLNASFQCEKKSSLRAEDTITHCLFLDDQFNCASCKNGYYLMSQFDYTLQKSTTSCQKVPLPPNCQAIDLDLLKAEGKVLCTRCRDGHAPDFHSSDEILSACQKTEGFANCLVQEAQSCLECELEYFLNNQNVCQKRVNLNSTCLEYALKEDKCNKLFLIETRSLEKSDAEVVSESIFIGLANAALFDVIKDLPVVVNQPPAEDPEADQVYEGESGRPAGNRRGRFLREVLG